MEVWILNQSRKTLVPATLMRGIDYETMLVQLDEGDLTTVHHRLVFRSKDAARMALIRSMRHERELVGVKSR